MRRSLVVILSMFSSALLADDGTRSTEPADGSLVGVAFLAPVQYPPMDEAVHGVRLSILAGWNQSVVGLDLASIGAGTGESFRGSQLAGVINANAQETSILGLQAAGVINYNGRLKSLWGQSAVNLKSTFSKK